MHNTKTTDNTVIPFYLFIASAYNFKILIWIPEKKCNKSKLIEN